MPFEWSNENTIKFLELLELERSIWDFNDKNHKLKHKVHDAWKRISESLEDTPIEELKSKKKSLIHLVTCATFRPLLKKKNDSLRSGASADDIFHPIWFAFDVMERFLGTIFTVKDTVNTEEQLLLNTPPSANESDVMAPRSPQSVETESSQSLHNRATKTKVKKRHMDHVISEADKKITDSFAYLSHVLEKKNVEEDECDVYAKLLAKKLRKYPERMREKMMYTIDGLLLDNPYPDERPSSASTSYSSHMYSMSSPYAQQTSPSPHAPIPSPQYVPIPSPQYAPIPSPQYAPIPSPQYAPIPSPKYAPSPSSVYRVLPHPSSHVNTYNTQAPVNLPIHIPEENITLHNEQILHSFTEQGRNNAQEELQNQIHILSQEVIVPAKRKKIIKSAYKDS